MTEHTFRETTDGRYVKIADDQWWDTAGIDIVPESVVDAHIDANPGVGIVVLTAARALALPDHRPTAFFLWGYRDGSDAPVYLPRARAEVRHVGGEYGVEHWSRGHLAAGIAIRYGVDLSGGEA